MKILTDTPEQVRGYYCQRKCASHGAYNYSLVISFTVVGSQMFRGFTCRDSYARLVPILHIFLGF